MVKRPTIEDLARVAGVSVATVDRVLNRRLPVRGDTAMLVVKAAEEIGFHATGLLRRRLVETPTKRFGFLLQKKSDAFYASLGHELIHAAKMSTQVQCRPLLEFADELVPQTISAKLRAMAPKCDAIAVVAVDHPTVNEAVEEIVAQGKPVFTLLSDLSTPLRSGYLAVDSRKAGRTAAWVIAHGAPQAGKVGILVGSHRYLSQETAEISFRTYMREHAPHLTLLEPIINLDDNRIAEEAVSEMLARHPDLVGIYASGGGQDGFIRALRNERKGRRIIAVCNELTVTSKAALIDGVLDLAIGTRVVDIAKQTIAAMAYATDATTGTVPTVQLLAPELHINASI